MFIVRGGGGGDDGRGGGGRGKSFKLVSINFRTELKAPTHAHGLLLSFVSPNYVGVGRSWIDGLDLLHYP